LLTAAPTVVEAESGPGASTSWHPHLGDIGGKCLNDILAQYAQCSSRFTVILATGERTGSEWLCELMGQTTVLGRPSEYLNTPWMRRFIPDYPDDVKTQMDIAKRLGTTANGCCALKLHSWHFDRLASRFDLSDLPNPKFIFLYRTDLLGQAISLVRARQTEKFHSFVAEARQPEYDAAQIDKALDEVILNKARWTKFFARNGIRPLRLNYEQFSLEPAAALTKIAEFVDVTIPSHIGQVEARLRMQRDASNLEWRQRFVAEKRSLAFLDPF
jgi:LPS sulfotransferase NodH